MSLTTQVEYYAGSASGYSAIVAQALSDGVVDVVTKVLALRPDQAQYFSYMSPDTSGAGVDLDYSLPVLFVSRHNYPCIRGTYEIKDKYVDPTSLVYATKYDPIYYIDKGGNSPKVIIKPDPIPTEVGYVTRVVIGTPVDNTGVISHFPDNYVHLVVKYAATRLLYHRLSLVQVEIDAKETTLASLRASIASNTGDISAVRTAVDGLSTDLSAFQSDFDDYIVAKDLIISEIGGYIADISAEVSAYQGQTGATSSQFAANLSLASGALASYLSSYGTLKSEVSAYISDIMSMNTLVGTYVDTDEDIELANAKAGQLAFLTSRLQNKLQEAEMDSTLFSSKIKVYFDTIQGWVAEHSVDTDATKVKLESIAAKTQNAISRASMLDRSVEVAVQGAELIVKQIGAQLKKAELISAENDSYSSQANIVTSEIQTLSASTAEMNGMLSKVIAEYTAAFDAIGGNQK